MKCVSYEHVWGGLQPWSSSCHSLPSSWDYGLLPSQVRYANFKQIMCPCQRILRNNAAWQENASTSHTWSHATEGVGEGLLTLEALGTAAVRLRNKERRPSNSKAVTQALVPNTTLPSNTPYKLLEETTDSKTDIRNTDEQGAFHSVRRQGSCK